MTIFDDGLFIKSELKTIDGKTIINCTLRDSDSGRFLDELVRSDSKGFVVGRMVSPPRRPDWMVPGTIFKSEIQGLKLTLTLQPTVQSRISGVTDILGEKIKFSYVVVSEFS
jgi:hypothetical protein